MPLEGGAAAIAALEGGGAVVHSLESWAWIGTSAPLAGYILDELGGRLLTEAGDRLEV